MSYITSGLNYNIMVNHDALEQSIDFKSFVDKYFNELAKFDTVGTKNGDEIHTEVRNSKFVDNVYLRDVNYYSLREKFEENDYYKFSSFMKYKPYKLHCYEENGFFARHKDGKKNSYHIGTILIFPPCHYSKFEGGNLILYPSSETAVVIKPSKFDQWTLVAFDLEVEHECLPVTSGKRFVFKTELEIPHDEILFNDIPAKPISKVLSTQYQEDKIDKLEKKINKLRAKQICIGRGVPTSKINKIINLISNSNGKVIVVLQSYVTKIEDLDGHEALLYNEIIKKWPLSSLHLKDVDHCKGDGCDEPSDVLFFDEEDEQLENVVFLYWKSPKTHKLGKLRDTRSDYNDSTYDNYHELSVSLICINK